MKALAVIFLFLSSCGVEYHKPKAEDGWRPTDKAWCSPYYCVEPGDSGLGREDVELVFQATLDAFEEAERSARHRQINRSYLFGDLANARLYIVLVVDGAFDRPGGCNKNDPNSKCGGLYHGDTRLLEVSVPKKSFETCVPLMMLPHELLHAFIQLADPDLFYSWDALGLPMLDGPVTPHPKAFFRECGSAEWEARRTVAIKSCGLLDMKCKANP